MSSPAMVASNAPGGAPPAPAASGGSELHQPMRRRGSSTLNLQRRGSGTSVASLASDLTTSTSASTAAPGGRTFPEKLMDMITTSTNPTLSATYSPSISWLPHGKSFVITDPETFTRDVLPRYFKSTKFKSFTRKLYRWGFRQITKGPDSGSYYHELFQRDHPEICVKMNCHYSDKELRTQADNAAKRRGSLGSVERPQRRGSGARDSLANATERLTLGVAGVAGSGGAGAGAGGGGARQKRHSIHGLPTRRGSFTLNEDDDDTVLAQIERTAAAFGGGGGGGTRSSLGGRRQSGGLLGSGRRQSGGGGGGGGRGGGGMSGPGHFAQARRMSATRRGSYNSAVSGLSGVGGALSDSDDDMGEVGVPASINIGGIAGASTPPPPHLSVSAVAAAQAQAAAQFGGGGGGGGNGTRTAEEILAQHRLEDAILAQQEAAIRARRQQLQKEQEDRLKALELMAAARSGRDIIGGGMSSSAAAVASQAATAPTVDEEALAAARIKAVQDQMSRARANQLQKEQEERLKALELLAAAKVQGALDAEAAARMKEVQEQMSRARAQQLQKEQEDRLKALELMAAAKAGQSVGLAGVGMDAETAARMKEVQEEMSASHRAMMQLQASAADQPPTAVPGAAAAAAAAAATSVSPSPLDILAAAGEKAAAEAAAAVDEGAAPVTSTPVSSTTSSSAEQNLVMDAMRKHQEMMAQQQQQ